MIGLGVFLLLVWLGLKIFGLALGAVGLILKISLVLIALGAVLDAVTGFRVYDRWRR